MKCKGFRGEFGRLDTNISLIIHVMSCRLIHCGKTSDPLILGSSSLLSPATLPPSRLSLEVSDDTHYREAPAPPGHSSESTRAAWTEGPTRTGEGRVPWRGQSVSWLHKQRDPRVPKTA